jgi:hypothetical protein
MANAKKNGKAAPISHDPGAARATEIVEAASLTPHPRNYNGHPDDQIAHLAESLKEHGFYRNVVVARGNVILAGHGVVQAAKSIGITDIPIVRLDLDPNDPRALKVLAGDNELARFSEKDDRALAGILRDIQQKDAVGLLGTGYDDKSLVAFLMVTRPASEIQNANAAAEWVGMPEYDEGGAAIQLLITFPNVGEREKFLKLTKIKTTKSSDHGRVWSARWPVVPNEDAFSLRFEIDDRKK